MSKPIVAVVGRPNVGKSTLFNKLCGQRLAIVEDTPGITRDRIFANCEWNGHEFLLVDTGGIEPKATEGILAHMREQAQIAIDTADCIIMVVDVRDGLTAADEDVAHMLRRSHKPIILAVNKCDKVGEAPMELYEFYNLGFDEVMPISSVHGHGTGDLLDAVCAHLDFSETVVEEDRIPVAIIGRPNVGKSSLTNRILGENRMIVANEAGTTRDAIDTPVDNAYGKFIFTDTAGLRKRSNITDGLERYMVVRALAAVERSRVALILVDATVGFTEQDSKVAGYAHDQGKACIIVVNKWDAVEGKETNTMEQQRRGYAEDFSFMGYAPIIFISAQTGYNVNKLMQLIRDVDAQNGARVPTGVLNEMLAVSYAGPCHGPHAAAQRQGPPPEDLLPDPGFHPPAHVCGLCERKTPVPLQLSAVSHQPDPRELWPGTHPHPSGRAGARLRRSGCQGRVSAPKEASGFRYDANHPHRRAHGCAGLPAGQCGHRHPHQQIRVSR